MAGDDELLLGTQRDPELFGAFYRHHEDAVLAFMVRRVRDPELAADLTAEVFAAALASVGRFKPRRQPAAAWLFGIARNVLGRSLERRRVEDRARRKLGMAPIEIGPDLADEILALEEDAAIAKLLATLPVAEADAVRARVVEGAPYAELAAELQCSEQVIRQRVSRGLARLRKSEGAVP